MPKTEHIIVQNERLQRGQYIHAWSIMLIPLLGFCCALAFAVVNGIHVWELVLLLVFYVVTMTGVEIGFHRYFSHYSFAAKPPLQLLLGIAGCMAAQGPLIYWVANHRRHHRFSDHEYDPHSPHAEDQDFAFSLKGLWHAHMGWAFRHESTNTALFAKDLLKQPRLFRVSQLYPLWIVLGLLLPTLIGFAIERSGDGALRGLLWGGLARVFLVQHFTFLVNSICHLYGQRPHALSDRSGNVSWLSLPTLGGSWHNNHHAYPSVAKLDFRWWQIDVGGWIIETFKKIGMVSEIKINQERMLR